MSSIVAVPRALKRRRALTWAMGAVVLAVIMLTMLCLGEVVTSPGEVLQALLGGADSGTRLVVVEWRLPRAVLGAAIGALLALSGALFQVVTRNPLGSPDILGFSAGASTGVLLVMLGGTASIVAVTTGAIVGGLASAALVFGLVAWRGASGVRVIIVGIAVTAMVGALNVMIQISADQLVVHAAAIWGVGSLNGIDGAWVVPMLVTLAVGGVVIAWLAPALRLYELGEDAAASLGVRPTALRLVAMLAGVVLVAMTISAAGPISFIALAAPQIARRVWRSGTIPFAASALVGAILLTLSDLLAARLFAPTMLPTGLVTVAVGGIYLAWMLSSGQERKR